MFFQRFSNQDSSLAISLCQCFQLQGNALPVLLCDRGIGPAWKVVADWAMNTGKEPHVASGGSDKHFHSLGHVAV